MDYVKIPLSRVGAIIGPKGETKKRIEEVSGCEIIIDSNEGLIEVKTKNEKDPLKNLQLISTAKAIGRGFTPDKAMQLLELDYYLEIVDIRDYVGRSKKRLATIRGRVIGKAGKTRKIIEDVTGADLAIQGHTVLVISDFEGLEAAKVAISMVLAGSEHGAVYKYLESFRRRLR